MGKILEWLSVCALRPSKYVVVIVVIVDTSNSWKQKNKTHFLE